MVKHGVKQLGVQTCIRLDMFIKLSRIHNGRTNKVMKHKSANLHVGGEQTGNACKTVKKLVIRS